MLGTIAAVALALLVVAPLSGAAEQTRETYVAHVEPICKANREVSERIMAGARKRVNTGKLAPASKQFIRLSGSIAKLAQRLAKVPPPTTDVRRIHRWVQIIRLLKTRVRLVGKYYGEGLKIKGNHEAILAERAGISANNTTIVLHFRYCRFGNLDRGGS